MIVASLALGTAVLAPVPNTDPIEYGLLLHQMEVGLAILSLMFLRFVIRLSTTLPEAAPTGRRFFDALAWLSHRIFYIFVFAQIASGLALAAQAHLPQILLAGKPGHLPPTF
jgi:cytochrome b561